MVEGRKIGEISQLLTLIQLGRLHDSCKDLQRHRIQFTAHTLQHLISDQSRAETVVTEFLRYDREPLVHRIDILYLLRGLQTLGDRRSTWPYPIIHTSMR